MRKDTESIMWNLEQIRTMVTEFEGRYLPIMMVGAIEGYCNNIAKIAERVQRLEPVDNDDEGC